MSQYFDGFGSDVTHWVHSLQQEIERLKMELDRLTGKLETLEKENKQLKRKRKGGENKNAIRGSTA